MRKLLIAGSMSLVVITLLVALAPAAYGADKPRETGDSS